MRVLGLAHHREGHSAKRLQEKPNGRGSLSKGRLLFYFYLHFSYCWGLDLLEGTFVVGDGQEGEIKTRQGAGGGGGEGQGEGRVSRAGGALTGGHLNFCTFQSRCNSFPLTHHLYGITKANRGLLFPQTRSCLFLTRKNAQRRDLVVGKLGGEAAQRDSFSCSLEAQGTQ